MAFIQIVFALGLLHLALDSAADALLDLENGDLAFHQRIDLLQPLRDGGHLEKLLLLDDLDGEVRGNGVGELRGIGDLPNRCQHFLRHLLVQLHIAVELRDGGAGQRLGLGSSAVVGGQHLNFRLEEFGTVGEAVHARAVGAFDEHLHGAVGQLQQLQHLRQGSHFEHGIGRRIIIGGVLLCDEQDALVFAHHLFQRLDRLFTPHEERNDHVREDDDVAERQDRDRLKASCGGRVAHTTSFHGPPAASGARMPPNKGARVLGR